MRCFVAIEIPTDIKLKIAEVMEKVGSGSRGIRWVPPENIHLTLKFLGETDDGMIPEIEEKLSAACMDRGPVTLDVRGTGVFPNLRHPNVLWVGIDESEGLKDIYLSIEEAMSGLGFEKEDRNFSPHVTIGRVKDRKGIDPLIKEFYSFSETAFGSAEVNEVLLMKSVLKPAGAEYSKIAAFKLEKRTAGAIERD